MSRRPARVTETDLRRAAKVATTFGVTIEIDGVRITPAPKPELTPVSEDSEISRELQKFRAEHGYG